MEFKEQIQRILENVPRVYEAGVGAKKEIMAYVDSADDVIRRRLTNLEIAASGNLYYDITESGIGGVDVYYDYMLPYAAVSKIGGRHTKGREKNLIPYPYNSGFSDQIYYSSCTVMDNASIVSSETYSDDIIWLVKSADKWDFGSGTFTLCAFDDLSRYTTQHANLANGGLEYGYKMVLALFKDGAWHRSIEVGVIDINSDTYTYRYSQTFTVELGEYDYATLCIYLYGSGHELEVFPQLESGSEPSGYDSGTLRISDPIGLTIKDLDYNIVGEYKIPEKLLTELKSSNYGYGLGDAEKYNYIDFINKQYVCWYRYKYTDGQITDVVRETKAYVYDISKYFEDDMYFELPNSNYAAIIVQSDTLAYAVPLEIKLQQKIV